MPLTKRILRATITLPQGEVVLDQTVNLKARISKAALAIQSRATVEVTNLSASLRTQLLSQFTLWHKRKVDSNKESQDWVSIKIEAGYETDGSESTSVVFVGEIVFCELVSPPPNATVRITCYTRQVDKTTFLSSQAPARTTFLEYVKWAAEQMGLGDSVDCQTSFNDKIIENPSQSMHVVGSLLISIQDMYKPAVAAFIDDQKLIVRDVNKIVNPAEVVTVKNFIGMPSWTEWGASFTTLFDQTIRLASGVRMESQMNPSLNDSDFVITDMDYDLTSRDMPFYVSARCSPAA